eukprot:GHVU01198553.1.p5 GENE.GHVU01198553.1~~GHVU01198553.1.p5  ORF type:complete len:113 (+),score=22.90 GHVU01198553.1:169-507(+)
MDRQQHTPAARAALERLEDLATLILSAARDPEDVYSTEYRSEIQHLLWLLDGRLALQFDGEHTETFLDGLFLRHQEEFSPPISDEDEEERQPVFLQSDDSSTRDTDDAVMDD